MGRAGPILVAVGLACAAIALALPRRALESEDALPPSHAGGAQRSTASGAAVAIAEQVGIAPSGWRSWSRTKVSRVAAAPVDPWPAPVVVTLPRRTSEPASLSPAPRDGVSLVRALQRELKRTGCYHGPVSGEWTRESRKAMQALTVRLNAELPVEAPDAVLLALVEGQPENICSASCPSGEGLGGDGRCLPTALLAKNLPTPPAASVTVTERAVPQTTVSGWTSGVTANTPEAAPPPVALPEGRMALAGPRSAGPQLQGQPAVPPQPIAPQRPARAGFGPGFFRQLDRLGNR
jgi:hypothetical protein